MEKSFDVYICYSYRDIAIAKYICNVLQKRNISVFIDCESIARMDGCKLNNLDAINNSKVFCS